MDNAKQPQTEPKRPLIKIVSDIFIALVLIINVIIITTMTIISIPYSLMMILN